MRVLVTAGPTREHLDRVRFLTNASTGRMGIEVARAAADAGHDVVLVLGPTHLTPPDSPRVRVLRIVSALDMLAACEAEWPTCDALVATAAVADQRPAVVAPGKPEKSSGPETLALVRNPDVLATLAATKGARPCIGFALQVDDAEQRARAKLVRKNLDWVVLDAPEAMGADRADFTLIPAIGEIVRLPGATKADVANQIVRILRRDSFLSRAIR
ncbi:MAG: phosphopantothenoylcysteine decarboxylase [Planctomycetes bacterium]|nr:phosphopantothenoylcysteine decarboxylase [Planctomycetota bacterium]